MKEGDIEMVVPAQRDILTATPTWTFTYFEYKRNWFYENEFRVWATLGEPFKLHKVFETPSYYSHQHRISAPPCASEWLERQPKPRPHTTFLNRILINVEDGEAYPEHGWFHQRAATPFADPHEPLLSKCYDALNLADAFEKATDEAEPIVKTVIETVGENIPFVMVRMNKQYPRPITDRMKGLIEMYVELSGQTPIEIANEPIAVRK